MSRRNREYIELLHKDFNELAYIDFVKDLLNLSNSDINENSYEINPTLKQYADDINFYKYFAKYNDGLNNIGAFIVKIKSTNERSKQRNFVASLLSKYDLDSALVAFYSDNESSWRISFVKKELSFTDKGIKQNLTPAKRYSYLVGKNESVHTAQEYLLKLLDIDDRKITINDIESVFDVEKVTKKFFEEYKEQFLRLQEYLSKNEDFKTESLKYDFDSVEFAKRLMGQIVFLYFLQKKGWLGVQLVPDELSNEEYNDIFNSRDSVSQNLLERFYTVENDKHKIIINEIRESNEDSIKDFTNIFINTKYNKMWGTGDKQFIRSMYKRAKIEHKNFFDDVLEPFFYDGLNHKRENQYFALLNCKIPFLNGGLFEPLNDYRWASAEFNIPDEYFSNDDETGILDFLDLYNFTIDEEEPLEKEIAVDPEMLGKIFENLLEVNDRKSKGAFYTPREIVYYMCQESLANYLVNKVGTNYDETIEFIKYGDLISQVDAEKSENKDNYEIGQTIYKNLLEIDNALKNVKVADPAVGSGAFPLGMLTEIVKTRNAITTYLKKNDAELLNINKSDRTIYQLKKDTIENCIYAVDIEISAVDIAKLRLWLSLIVDYPNDKEPQPLPNLDCKIMQGNSLVDEYEGVELFSNKIFDNIQGKKYSQSQLHLFDVYVQQTLQFDENSTDINSYIEEMLKLQKQYFLQSDNKLKRELKNKIENIQFGMIETSLSNEPKKLKKLKIESKKRQKPWFIWKLEFYDVFKNNGGFDIVIGNPPYVGEKKHKNIFEIINNTKFGKKYHMGRMDLFYYFFHKSIDIANDNGIISFITTNYYITADGGEKLRTDFSQRANLFKIVNFNDMSIFETAKGQHNMLTFLRKKAPKNDDITYVLDCNLHYNKTLNEILSINQSDYQQITKNMLFDTDKNYIRIVIDEHQDIKDSILQKVIKNSQKLEDICNVNQGAITGVDKIKESHILKYGNQFKKGEGVFVITKSEAINNNLLDSNLIKPWFKNSDIKRYFVNNENVYYVIYSKDDKIFSKENENVYNYLYKYKKILEDRDSEYPWYLLDRPRNEKIFESPKIICPQRSLKNCFGYCSTPWYSSADVYYITNKDNFNISLKYVIALLNSKLYYYWFFYQGKRKGKMLELYRTPLSEVPIFIPSMDKREKIINLVDDIIKEKNNLNFNTRNDKEDLLDNIIYKMFNLSQGEIDAIEKLYK
jgi:adenine-specific DNA-methyltransferase